MYPLGPAVSLAAAFFSLVVSVGLITSSLSEHTITTLRGGEILLGLALRGEALLDLDLFPGRGLESWDLEFPQALPGSSLSYVVSDPSLDLQHATSMASSLGRMTGGRSVLHD